MTSTPKAIRILAQRQKTIDISRLCRRTFSISARTRHNDIGIIGGGITGLGCAYFASKKYPNSKITVYEQSKRFGGWLQSTHHTVPDDGGTILFESGPRTLRPAGNGRLTLSMLEDLGLKDDLIVLHKSSPQAASRYIYYPDHLIHLSVPPQNGWYDDLIIPMWTEEAFQGIFKAILTEWSKKPRSPEVQDESVGEFMSRRLSRSLVDRLLSAVFHGIYAGNVWQLSARSLLKNAYRNELVHGSLTKATVSAMRGQRIRPVSKSDLEFETYLQHLGLSDTIIDTMKKASIYTFGGGVGQLTDALIAYLKRAKNVTFAPDTQIKGITQRAGKIEMKVGTEDASATPIQHERLIYTGMPNGLGPLGGATAKQVPSMISETVMTVNLYYKTPNMHPPGFGYLIPLGVPLEQNPENALGVVFDTSYSIDPQDPLPGLHGPAQDMVSSRGTKLTVMLGGHYWEHWSTYPSEEDGLRMAKDVVKRHLGILQDPLVSAVNLQKNCIPRYTVGHHKKLEKIHDWLINNFNGRLKVAGSWVVGVGVNDCLRSAWNAVHVIDDFRSTNLNSAIYEEPSI